MQCNDQEGNTQWQQKTQHDNYITEIFTYTAMALIYSVPVECVLLLLYSINFTAAHQPDGTVIDRLAVQARTLQWTDFTDNLQWPLGQSCTLIPKGESSLWAIFHLCCPWPI